MPDIDGVELLTIASREPNEKYNGWTIRVIQWVKDGKSISVQLENRKTFLKDGEIRPGKAKGFSAKDLDTVKPHWAKIMALLRNPPAVKPKDPEPDLEPVDGFGDANDDIPFEG